MYNIKLLKLSVEMKSNCFLLYVSSLLIWPFRAKGNEQADQAAKLVILKRATEKAEISLAHVQKSDQRDLERERTAAVSLKPLQSAEDTVRRLFSQQRRTR